MMRRIIGMTGDTAGAVVELAEAVTQVGTALVVSSLS